MVGTNRLLQAPPYRVESALRELGGNLRTARLRRRLTIAQVAEKIGTGVRAVRDAEKGKPSTAIASYGALLWLYGLIDGLADLADPGNDIEGSSLAAASERQRGRRSGRLNNDF